MKKIILAASFLFFANLLSSQTNGPINIDDKWSIHLGYFQNDKSLHSYELSFVKLKDLGKNFALETMFGYNYKVNDLSFFGITDRDAKSHHLKTETNIRYMFGAQKRWFIKTGLNVDWRFAGDLQNELKLGFNAGIGYIIPLKNGKQIELELNNRYMGSDIGLEGGLKIGLRF